MAKGSTYEEIMKVAVLWSSFVGQDTFAPRAASDNTLPEEKRMWWCESDRFFEEDNRLRLMSTNANYSTHTEEIEKTRR